MNFSLNISQKINAYFQGQLSEVELMADDDLAEFLQVLQKEVQYPFSLSSGFNLPPHGLLKGLHVSGLPLLVTDTSGTIQYANPAFEKMTGYALTEILGKNPRIFQSGLTDQTIYQKLWEYLERGDLWQGELLNRKKNGQLYWEWAFIVPIKDAQGRSSHYLAVKQEITERKRLESEWRYQAILLNSLSDAVLSVDLEMTVLSWNQAAEQLYGWSSDEAIGQNWLELQPNCVFTGTSRDDVLQAVLKAGAWSGRVTQAHRMGAEIPVLVTCSQLQNSQGEVVGLVIINRDLSQHEALLNALQTSQERFFQVTNTLQEMVFCYDMGSQKTSYLNHAAEQLSGIPFGQLEQNFLIWQKYLHPEDLPGFRESFQNYLTKNPTGVWEYEFRFIRPDQRMVWFSSSARVNLNAEGQPIEIWGITKDITLRKKIEAELIQSEKFAYGILNALGAHICVLDRLGNVIMTNEAWDAFSKFNQGEHDYLGWNYLDVCKKATLNQAAEAQAVFNGIKDVLSGEKNAFVMEYPCHSPAEKRWFQIQVHQLDQDDEGRIVIFHQNITPQKQAQENLRLFNEDLEAEVALRTEALNKSLLETKELNQQLILANQMKDTFLANMSHELRTPLTGILGMSDLLSQQVLGGLNPKQLNSVNTIRNSGQHLLNLINDILDLSKVQAGKLELHPEEILLSNLGQEVLSLMRPLADDKNICLELQIEPFDLKVWADLRSLKQILINLLSNAVKFTPDSGKVGLHVKLAGRNVLLMIQDTGIGIAAEDLDKLFQPFVQIDSGFSRKYAGTGLGLSLVHELVAAHGGRIEVSSRLEKGSCFSVYLPGNEKTEDQESEHSEALFTQSDYSAQAKEGRPLLLLVDDNPVNIEVIRSFLEYFDFQVCTQTSPHQALTWLESHRPHLILMDIQMPEMSGIEVVQAFRQFENPDLLNTPVIALTSLAMAGDQERILKEGFDDYLSKPVDFKLLCSKIMHHLKEPHKGERA
ncbi:hypothetical protein COW36_15000 [bacterium (Candidatus Blackallbacteria) CG17_big_fil_post_rev_8_21_14_2_50_48_46]|uniref:histidine kinase n=1 Tax=bacterium (Candidatus Blackallbacteria) CG17_big_fil_post_rev_8_21_14_2_50_48_46 TaxID=2014261 RepID=A0A2M7G2I6_9BACT|nr:MAG: hypothetical protein COW64_11550 [bacterium (Candidatus Blackallbacteria) CG18_big_fil_WC_8_21_14_2_50_49_26]PIW16017.1 MAG: hypothetical protein COW36_15000 [bacterium (Candidatus Blackallbacteria) CG17_big_fil_post_rev_8_21_14_2_50_48_46]PIW50429.1 MAG: hypothetical protein COW20_02715 [bacterium (Candidatus Blackallbacteria) CG13_big_fil_rev_8_21_14_2_50_49_14]